MRRRYSKDFLVTVVQARKSSDLIPTILRHIEIGSTIFTDCFSVYVNNQRFPKESKLIEYGYNYQFVDHSKEFVSPLFDHIHTNTIERLWREIKVDLKRKRITTGYLKAIANFYFHKTLTKQEQIGLICQALNKFS